MKTYGYYIESAWSGDRLGASDIGARLLATLDGLTRVNPAMCNWRLADLVDLIGISLADFRGDLTAFVEKNISRHYESGEPTPEDGFDIWVMGSKVHSEDMTPQRVTINLTTGSPIYNKIRYQVGDSSTPPDLALINHQSYLGALKVLASNWPCPWARADAVDPDLNEPELEPATEWRAEWSEPYNPPDLDRLVWMGYLSAPLVAGLTSPPELISERTPGGGLILSATRERFDLANPDHRRLGQMLKDIMNRHTSNTTEVTGWPRLPPRVGAY